MQFSFKNGLLATSCLVLSLSVSHPGFSMEMQNEGNSSAVQSKKLVKKTEEDSFFTTTDFGTRKFDSNTWAAALFQFRTENDKVEQLFQVLEESAYEGDEKALEKLYLFSTKQLMGINRINEAKAAKALKMGRRREHEWVVPIYVKKIKELEQESKDLIAFKRKGDKIESLILTARQEELLNLHRIVANTPLRQSLVVERSEKFLEYLFPFHAQTWVEGSCVGTNKEDIDTLLIRLKKYGYYKYFAGLYEGTRHVKPKNRNATKFLDKTLQFLLEGAALEDPMALHKLSLYYKTNRQCEESIKISLRLAQKWEQVETMYNLGVEYNNGSRVEKDPQKAFEWYAKAADKGMHRAILELIKTYWLTNDEKQDFAKAFKWLQTLEPEAERIATKKDKNSEDMDPAQVFVLLGRCYHYGHGVEKDEKKAFNLFTQAAQLGEKNALIHVAMAYQYGNGVEKNLGEAIKRWENATKRYPNEVVHMGQCYEDRGHELQQTGNSKDATKHFTQAYNCYERVAQKQDAHAMYKIAVHHYLGLGRPKNLKLVREWLTKAAKAGYVEAMYALGNTYLFSKPKNLKFAEEWLQKAVEKEHPTAMLNLGWLYYIEQNKGVESFNVYKKAASLGSEIAQYNCGLLLLSKNVSETDDDEARALSYLHQSVEKGHAPAMTLLGKYYLERSDGESEKGKQNLESAYFWLEKAATLDDFDAKTLLKEAESKLDNESDDSRLSPNFDQCLKNLENVERGIITINNELEIDNQKLVSPFEELREEKSETESSDNESELLPEASFQEDNQEESFETWKQFTPPKNEDLFKNPKLLRTQLREAGLALKRKQQECQITHAIQLDSNSSLIISMLKSKHERKNITYASLYKLFSDPYFKAKGHVDLQPTKSGLAISAKSFVTMQARSAEEDVMTTGTHHNHDKTYKGYNPEFLKNVVKILDLFGV